MQPSDVMVYIPREAAADLVAFAVDQLWSQWTNDGEGCQPDRCAPCHALRSLRRLGLMDALYAAHLENAGGLSEAWDAELQQVDRRWLDQAWAESTE